MILTVRQAAELLSVSPGAIRVHLSKINAPKHGAVWLIDDAVMATLKQRVQGKAGRPRK